MDRLDLVVPCQWVGWPLYHLVGPTHGWMSLNVGSSGLGEEEERGVKMWASCVCN